MRPHAFVTYTIEDAKGARSVSQFNFPVTQASNTGINALKDAAGAGAALVDALIKGKVVSAGVGIAIDLTGVTIKATPTADSDVEEGARFIFNAASGSSPSFRLASFDEDFILAGTQTVDLEDTDVDALVDFIVSGHTLSGVTVTPSDDGGSDITSIASARESFQSSR